MSPPPPGQYVTNGFPVLAVGPTPPTPLDEWSFTISAPVDEPVSWPSAEFIELAAETATVDINCVTKWSKLDTAWRGVSLDTLFDGIHTEGTYVSAWSDGGYTTNLPLEYVTGSNVVLLAVPGSAAAVRFRSLCRNLAA